MIESAAAIPGSGRNTYQPAIENGSTKACSYVPYLDNQRDITLCELLKPDDVGADDHCKYNRPGLTSHRQGMFLDKYRRQVWDAPGTTIVAHLARDGHMHIHPRQVLSIIVREPARLKSFPDDFIFLGPRTGQFEQVGNAVPPLRGARMRSAVLKALERFSPGESDG